MNDASLALFPPLSTRADVAGKHVAALIARLRLVHQVPGRVRIKLLDAMPYASAPSEYGLVLERSLAQLPGMRALRLNPLARSCTLEYDPEVIPDAAWPDLIHGRATPQARQLMTLLASALAEAVAFPLQSESTP
ncbi:MAG: hypothetical protein ACP5OY_08345 [Halothiobacillaceae bacterium]